MPLVDTTELVLRRPDDWHLHLRDGPALAAVVGHTAATFSRALVMPNLVPPVRSVHDAREYQKRIVAALGGSAFTPLFALYLTDNTTPDEVRDAARADFVVAYKLYPAGATTNSDAGVTDIDALDAVLEVMESTGMVLAVHGEVTDPGVDVFDREKAFLERVLEPLLERHPGLKVVIEHATTADAVQFVQSAGPNLAATLTAHHLLMSRNAMFEGGLRPHRYCLPVLKRERHRLALVDAAVSGSPRFFLGTDSAPHARGHKESACGCAGMYTAATALELYAEVFEREGALDRLEAFSSEHGARFYGLPLNEGMVTLNRRPTPIPDSYPFGTERLVPFRAGGETEWTVDSIPQ